MRLRDIVLTANSNLSRSKTRTALTVLSIFIGALTITLTIGITSGTSIYIDKQVSSIGAKDVLLIQPKIEIETGSGPVKYDPDKGATSTQAAMMNSMFDDKDINRLTEQSGIRDVKPLQLVSVEYAVGPSGDKYQFDVQPIIDSMNLDMLAGRKPDNNAKQSEVLLTADYVKAFGFDSNQAAVGQTLTLSAKTPSGALKDVKATVSGVQEKSLFSQGGASVNDRLTKQLADIQSDGLPPEVSQRYMGAYAQFDDSISDDELGDIKTSLSEAGFDASTIDDQLGVVKQVINAITAVMIFFGAIALLAASFGIVNTLFMSVQERTKEIGLMKAMGMARSKVFLLFSVEAVMIGFWGSIAGIAVAIGIGQIANRVASEGFLKDLPGFTLTAFPAVSLLIVGLVIMLIAFLAGTLPARRAAKQDPIEALRYE